MSVPLAPSGPLARGSRRAGSRPATSLRSTGSRLAWAWCLLYTSAAPVGVRRPRRAEIRSHLWESEQAGLTASAVLLAAACGMAADLGWVVRVAGRRFRRALADPAAFLAAAVVLVVQAAFGWSAAPPAVGGPVMAASTIAAAFLVLASSAVWWRRRSR